MVASVRVSECSYYKEHGKSYYIVCCPHCKTENICYAWSVAGSGKRCQKCRALITMRGGEFFVDSKE